MRRTFLTIAAALGLTLGLALPVGAALEVHISIDCDDGDSIPLSVDMDTLSALTSAVAALNDSGTGVSCTLNQLAAPLPVVTFGTRADAASGGYVIGGGSVNVGCPNDNAHLFVGYFSVKIYRGSDGGLRGSANLRVPDGQACVSSGQLWSKPTCLAIVPNSLYPRNAWANSFVNRVSGSFFTAQFGKTIGWAFQDFGPNGGSVVSKDRWRVEEKPGSCPVYGDPYSDYYTLLTGDVAVQP